VIHHLADLEADFRAIYHLTPADVARMPGPQFFALAYRVAAYDGVIAGRMAAASEESTPSTKHGGRVESTPMVLQTDPALADLIDYG